jgi:hypothetical protein
LLGVAALAAALVRMEGAAANRVELNGEAVGMLQNWTVMMAQNLGRAMGSSEARASSSIGCSGTCTTEEKEVRETVLRR